MAWRGFLHCDGMVPQRGDLSVAGGHGDGASRVLRWGWRHGGACAWKGSNGVRVAVGVVVWQRVGIRGVLCAVSGMAPRQGWYATGQCGDELTAVAVSGLQRYAAGVAQGNSNRGCGVGMAGERGWSLKISVKKEKGKKENPSWGVFTRESTVAQTDGYLWVHAVTCDTFPRHRLSPRSMVERHVSTTVSFSRPHHVASKASAPMPPLYGPTTPFAGIMTVTMSLMAKSWCVESIVNTAVMSLTSNVQLVGFDPGIQPEVHMVCNHDATTTDTACKPPCVAKTPTRRRASLAMYHSTDKTAHKPRHVTMTLTWPAVPAASLRR
ncbi:hypothetical protein EDB84DRAFT_1443616 [Lactarius hengduanensis]|nr:hypothetical protein EDB84DRAFT_1443616 [Lactarius hengduanensis]